MRKYIVILMMAFCVLFTGCADPVGDGTALLEEGKYEEARDKFETAVEKEKNLVKPIWDWESVAGRQGITRLPKRIWGWLWKMVPKRAGHFIISWDSVK